MKVDAIGLIDLRCFVAVAEELHFGRAAQRLHMSQPPFSQRIRRLEGTLGTPLLHRTTRRVWLTDAGAALLEDARDILGRTREAVRRVRAVAEGEEGRLGIAAVTPAMDSFLPDAVRRFRAENPRIAVTLEERSTQDQLDALRADRIQLGFVRLFDHDVHGLATRKVQTERLVLAVPEGHALAGRREVRLATVALEPRVALARSVQPGLTDRIAAAFAAVGAASHPIQEAMTVHGVTALVAAGVGVALVPESAMTLRRVGIVFMRVRGRLPRATVSAVWRRTDSSTALERFVAMLPRP